ncbi:hypothetical protein LZC95_35450 [Pendulispora brunnea]|uniref:Uncharacterized protein n=1 Tax=Pendulispora brunnea TaxID=2905690 RepID=A0ABZ2K2G4_9BACT
MSMLGGLGGMAARELLTRDALADLVEALRSDGYDILGPLVRDGAIVIGPIEALSDLPAGMTDEQEPGSYRLRRRQDGALFGYAVGPHSYKREFLLPEVRLLRIRRSKEGLAIDEQAPVVRKRALLGVRACELAAMAVQDRVLLGGPFADADYAARRRDVVIIAVQCGEAGGTCFCASMGTGPAMHAGFDLALTELLEPHRFVVDVGSDTGRTWLSKVPHERASREDCELADAIVARTAARMGTNSMLTASATCWRKTSSTCIGTPSPNAALDARIARWYAPPASARPSRTV